jgi:hypothetical protein
MVETEPATATGRLPAAALASATAAWSMLIRSASRPRALKSRALVGGDQFRAGADIVLVHLPHDVGMGEIGIGAPGLAAHGPAAALDVGAGAAVDDDDLARLQLLLDLRIHHVPLRWPAARKAFMWKRA